MQPVNASCDHRYLRAPLDGDRPLNQIRWIVLHDTEGGTAQGIAQYFQHNSSGYTHLVVDDQGCYRCLRDVAIPRGAHGANQHGFHIEQCGYAKWSAVLWGKHLNTLKRAAYKTALHCHKFHIPARFLKAADLKADRTGITTHAECSKAFGGTHWDPGAGWPRWLFMRYVRTYLKQIEGGQL